jgi:hypothetical protein
VSLNLLESIFSGLSKSQLPILDTAAGQIRDEAREAARARRLDQSRTLDSIAERNVRIPGGKENSFGLALVELFRHFSLPDADIVDAHYMVNPRTDRISATTALTNRR